MRERRKFGLPGSDAIESAPPWLRNVRQYKREPAHGSTEVIMGYADFSALRGTEREALAEAVQEISPETTVQQHHQRRYTFVYLPTDKAELVEAKLRDWGYSSENQVDLIHEALFK
jgi:hypothetical protein